MRKLPLLLLLLLVKLLFDLRKGSVNVAIPCLHSFAPALFPNNTDLPPRSRLSTCLKTGFEIHWPSPESFTTGYNTVFLSVGCVGSCWASCPWPHRVRFTNRCLNVLTMSLKPTRWQCLCSRYWKQLFAVCFTGLAPTPSVISEHCCFKDKF
jgi:hypothetical protein